MKTLRILFIGTLAFLALASCNNKDSKDNEALYASQATISCSDDPFTATSAGGTIKFGVEGGQVIVYVDCETDWTAENSGSDWLDVSANSEYGRVVVTAEQSTVQTQQTATITLATAKSGIEFAVISVTQDAYDAPTITVGTTEYNFPAVGALTAEISVEANGEWTVQNTSTWLNVEKTDTGVTITAEENEDTEARDVEITLTCSDNINSATATIAVSQDAKASISISDSGFTFFGEADSSSIEVTSNYDWEYSTDSSDDWFSVENSGSSIVVTVTENDEDGSREGTITVTAGDGADNVVEAQITVSQYSINSLIYEYTIVESDTEIALPLSGTVDATIDWGDGSEAEAVTSTYPHHTFAEPGVYYIAVSGKATSLNSNNSNNAVNRTLITGLKQWGHTGLTSLYTAFASSTGLKYLPEHTGTSLEDLSYLFGPFAQAFAGCSALESIPADLFSDSPKSTVLLGTFQNCYSLKTLPEGLFDDCAVITFQYTFQNCTGLTSVPASLFDKCTTATGFYGCFSGCSGLSCESPYTVVDGVKVHLYERSADNGFSAPSTYKECFSSCVNLTDYADIPSGWK